MNKKDIKIFEDVSVLAKYFCEELMKLTSKKEKVHLVLSGGSTPKIIFQILTKDYVKKIDWKKIHFFWGDERCVTPDDEESNYGMTKKYLLDHIDIPKDNVHRIKGENDPVNETNRYSEEIKSNVPFYKDLPLFDLVMLGIGEDGHTASIFPDQMNLLNYEKICEVAVHPSSGQKRITMTGKVLNNAERIIFLVTGNSKSRIVKEILEGKEKDKYPASKVSSIYGKTDYFIDNEAAKLLT